MIIVLPQPSWTGARLSLAIKYIIYKSIKLYIIQIYIFHLKFADKLVPTVCHKTKKHSVYHKYNDIFTHYYNKLLVHLLYCAYYGKRVVEQTITHNYWLCHDNVLFCYKGNFHFKMVRVKNLFRKKSIINRATTAQINNTDFSGAI